MAPIGSLEEPKMSSIRILTFPVSLLSMQKRPFEPPQRINFPDAEKASFLTESDLKTRVEKFTWNFSPFQARLNTCENDICIHPSSYPNTCPSNVPTQQTLPKQAKSEIINSPPLVSINLLRLNRLVFMIRKQGYPCSSLNYGQEGSHAAAVLASQVRCRYWRWRTARSPVESLWRRTQQSHVVLASEWSRFCSLHGCSPSFSNVQWRGSKLWIERKTFLNIFLDRCS